MNDENRRIYLSNLLQTQVDALIETFVEALAHEDEERDPHEIRAALCEIRAALCEMIGSHYASQAMVLRGEVREPQIKPFC